MKWIFLAALGAMFATAQPATTAEAGQNFVILDAPKSLPEIQFQDGEGRDHALTDFHGKVVLLNVWATWCVPCRQEMPTLDRLQAELGGPDFEVVTLSIDRGGAEAVRKFYAEIGIQHLDIRIDVASAALRTLGVVGLPTTVLIDRESREVGRLIGPADWDTQEMIALFKSVIAQHANALPTVQQVEKHS